LNLLNCFDGALGTKMRKAAHPSASGGMGSSNPRRWSRGGTHKIVKNIVLHFLIF
jgi:hypothetical protein